MREFLAGIIIVWIIMYAFNFEGVQEKGIKPLWEKIWIGTKQMEVIK